MKNFALTTVASAPSPADSGTTLSVPTGHGEWFPDAPFNAVLVPADTLTTEDNSEIVRVTSVANDTFIIIRAQDYTTAKSVEVGWSIFPSLVDERIANPPDTTALETDLAAETSARIAADMSLADSITAQSSRAFGLALIFGGR